MDLFQIVKYASNFISLLYFRRVNFVGLENIPNDGPLIICGNHANQFIDPIMIASNSNRNISFTMAASSFTKPIIGSVAKGIKAIPVKRPEDSKIKGGNVKIERNDLNLYVKGMNFLEETKKLSPGWQIILGTKTLKVEKVIDDQTIQLCNNQDVTDINGEVVLNYLPKTDNSSLFKDSINILKDNGCICIFPEGTSHDRTNFIKLKAGIAFIALGAMLQNGLKPIKILPVGLNYFGRDQFRSNVTVNYGTPFEVPVEWAEEFKTDKKLVVEKLLYEIESRMKEVTITADSYEDLNAILLLRNMYIPKNHKLSPTEHSELSRRFVSGYSRLSEFKEGDLLKTKTLTYLNELNEIHIDDNFIKNNHASTFMKIGFLLKFIVIFIIIITIFLPGILLLSPFVYLTVKKSEKERLIAKEKNPNKINATDVVSSVKVFYFLKLLPLIFLIYLAFSYIYVRVYYGFSSIFILIPISIFFPIYFYFLVKSYDYTFQKIYSPLTKYLTFLIIPNKLNRLIKERQDIVDLLNNMIDKYIEDINKEWKDNRIIKKENLLVDEKDDISYLERRFIKRKNTQTEEEKVLITDMIKNS